MQLKSFFIFLLLGTNLLLTGGLYAIWYYTSYNVSNNTVIVEDISLDKENSISNEVINDVYVEIKGMVNKPGVYSLSSSSIINDVVLMAGGFKKGAYTNNINLSKNIKNEMVIYVYSTSEYNNIKENNNINNTIKECVCEIETIDKCIDIGESIITTEKDDTQEQIIPSEKEENTNNKININTASKDELMMLSGVGEAKANAIIEYRNTTGYFKTIEDIKNVSGISDTIYEKIKDSIEV